VKALLFTNLFPAPNDPIRGLFSSQLAEELARLCDLQVAVPLPWVPANSLWQDVLPEKYRALAVSRPSGTHHGVPVDYLRYFMVPKIAERLHADLMVWGVRRSLHRLRRRFPFDVVNAHWLYPDGVAAIRLGRELDVPVVLTGLGCDVNEFLAAPGVGDQIRSALAKAAAITTVSVELARVLIKAGVPPERVQVIPNGVDAALFHPASRTEARSQLRLEQSGSIVVCVSRLSSEKGVHVLVEAAAAISVERPDARIYVIGDGPERQSLSRQIIDLGLTHLVQLAGSVPHANIATWLAAANVVCLPSLREGHPNAAMEAFSSGRPLVASRVGALQSMVDERLGILVEPDNPAALARALCAAMSTDWDSGIIAAAVANASWAASAQRYAEVMAQVARRAPHAA